VNLAAPRPLQLMSTREDTKMSAENRDDEGGIRTGAAKPMTALTAERAPRASRRRMAVGTEVEELIGTAAPSAVRSTAMMPTSGGVQAPSADDELEGYDDDADDDELEDEAAGEGEGEGALPEVSRKIRRRRRRSRPRSKTIAMKRLTREELRQGALMYPPVDVPRPQSRAECTRAPGEEREPCPWVACKHHLYLDVNPETGSIKINFPDLEPWEIGETCALDVAERGGITLEEVGEIMNLTRERIRQVEVRGLLKLKMASPSPDELGADLLKAKQLGMHHDN
jgi:hypothetical protein